MGGPTSPPPSQPPPGWRPPQNPPPHYQPAQLPKGWQDPSGWWWDGRKWRPPVPQLTRWQLISQIPGALIKLVLLAVLLMLLVVFLWSAVIK